MRHAKGKIIGCTVAALIAGIFALAGCAPQAQKAPEASEGPIDGPISVVEYDLYNPIVKTLDNGVLVQRVPNEDISASSDATAQYHHPDESVPYNTYFLKADTKGCNACHEDLAKTVANMPYGHVELENALGVEVTVDMCFACHTESGAITNQESFGTLIHGIHQETGYAECQNCHNATNDGAGMQLWDAVKHEQMRGLTDIADVDMEDAFSYRTDETIAQSDLFDVTWLHYDDVDYEIWDHVKNNDPLDEQMFDEWTLTFSGEVEKPVTFKLTDLIEQAPVETKTMKMNCLANPIGGPLIGQVEVTGIPLEWLLEQAGMTDDAQTLRVVSSGGKGYGSARDVDYFIEQGALVVYQIDGEPLSWLHGYPCMLVSGGVAADADIKCCSDFILESEDDIERSEGKADFSGNYYGKPGVGVFDLYEGQVVKAGEPFTVRGYADGWNESIAAIEISLDRGKTWKRFDTPDTSTLNWVTWEYTFTPAEESAYCISVRAVSETGRVTTVAPNTGRSQDSAPVEKMIVAKNEIPEVEGEAK